MCIRDSIDIVFTDEGDGVDPQAPDEEPDGQLSGTELSFATNWVTAGEGEVTLSFSASEFAGVVAERFESGTTTAPATITLTITAPPPVPVLSVAATAEVAEGASGTVQVRLSEAAPSGGISGTYTLRGLTAAETDYATTSNGVFTITQSTETTIINVSGVEDADAEANETFELSIFSDDTGAAVVSGSSGRSVVTILDNDPEVDFSLSTPSVTEGEVGTVEVTATYAVNAETVVTMELSPNEAVNGRTEAADFAGGTTTFTATLAEGDASAEGTFTSANDNLVEGPESFSLDFGTLRADDATSGPVRKSGVEAVAGDLEDNDTAALTVTGEPTTGTNGTEITFTGTLAVNAAGSGDPAIVTGDSNRVIFEIEDPFFDLASTLTFEDVGDGTAGDTTTDGLLTGVELEVEGDPVWPLSGAAGEIVMSTQLRRAQGLPSGEGVALTEDSFSTGTSGSPAETRLTVLPAQGLSVPETCLLYTS
ncbi:MAG: hypothetical protein MPK62_10325, partial [Alphaproteobacteria bacterium]|nr:hypothetical protein [Alphaproteobacteria bacterium]